MYNQIGTCSLCGGAVVVPQYWHGVIPPTPTCINCGAIMAQHGPIIPMMKQPIWRETTTGTLIPKQIPEDSTATPMPKPFYRVIC